MTVVKARHLVRSVRLPDDRRLDILRGVDLSVEAGEAVAIMGRSGSGKSTLLALLGLLANASQGALEVLGMDVTHLSDKRRALLRNEHIGFVFQTYSLVRHLSAFENVELPLRYGSPVKRRDRKKRVLATLEMLGLNDRHRSRPRQLSGGEQQRVAIARALIRQPALILADEPTGALDEETAKDVLTALRAACLNQGCALVIVTHDPQVAATMHRTLQLTAGTLHVGVGA